MKKVIKLLGTVCAVGAIVTFALTAAACTSSGPLGPAPNSGDGISDGSGLEKPNGPNTSIESGEGPYLPAPNSGDGIPDGSGF